LDGSMSSIKIVKGVSPECDSEVTRLLGLFPKWKPAKQSGREVRVRFVLPVKFAM
jgi:periplasmic protein TonB